MTNGYVVPFVVGLVAFAAMFLALDALIMSMQGLSLIFHK